jgi:ribonuclease T2
MYMKYLVKFILVILLSISGSSQAYSKKDSFDYYVLALSWQSAFCEYRSKKSECRSQKRTDFSASNFILHGLWPNKKGHNGHRYGYCNVSYSIKSKDKKRRWCKMPVLNLSDSVRRDLNRFMPGTMSCLQRHEWYKHGTCSGLSENDYYAVSNRLVDLFSKTDFNKLVANNVGNYVRRSKLLKAFDQEFGKGSRAYLGLRCKKVKGKNLLMEIRIQLGKDLSIIDNLKDVLPTRKFRTMRGNCPSHFKIDAVGINR